MQHFHMAGATGFAKQHGAPEVPRISQLTVFANSAFSLLRRQPEKIGRRAGFRLSG
jgi:hypothetical protein